MKISIIIPVINEVALIAAAIEKAWAAGADEVIIVDGGSHDGTRETASRCRGLLIDSPLGRGIQMNRGAEAASDKHLLLFLHVDNWLETDACDQIRDAVLQSEKLQANRQINHQLLLQDEQEINLWGGFQQRIENNARKYRWLEKGNAARIHWQSLVYGDQGLFVSADLFRQVGGFLNQPLMEDFEISRRLSQIIRPVLLPGPLHVSSRRWEQNGVVSQTVRNWMFCAAYRWGVSAESLSRRYRRHDK